jgi:protein-tyrosine phosphatase
MRPRRSNHQYTDDHRRGRRWLARRSSRDLDLVGLVLVTHCHSAQTVVHRLRNSSGADRVSGVHGRNEPEGAMRLDTAHPWDVNLALGQRSNQHVERLFWYPVEFFDIQQPTAADRVDERSGDERFGLIAASDHDRRIVMSDQAARRELSVAFHKMKAHARRGCDRSQQSGLAGAWWAFEQEVTAGLKANGDQLSLATHPDDGLVSRGDQRVRVVCVPGRGAGIGHAVDRRRNGSARTNTLGTVREPDRRRHSPGASGSHAATALGDLAAMTVSNLPGSDTTNSPSSFDLIERAVAAGVPSTDLPNTVDPSRLIAIDGTLNFRELGGIRVAGGTVRRGVLFRSDQLSDVSDHGLGSLARLGLRHVYDFRLPVERERQPSRLPGDVPVTHVATGDLGAAEAMVAKIPNMLTGVEPIAPASWWDENYVDMLGRAGEMFSSVIGGLSSGDGVPALFHCTGGKDRTGMAAMLILDVLGADQDDIIDDFLATNVFRTPRRLPHWEPQFAAAGIDRADAMPILGVTRSGITAALAEIRSRGGAAAYLNQLGITDAQLDGLRKNLVEPTAPSI